jgi:transposase
MAPTAAPPVTIGVDTHLDVHVAHAADQLGRRVDTVQVPTTPTGYHDLLAWARGPRRARRLGRGGHRLLRRRPGPLPCHRRPGRPGGQPARPPSPAPPRHLRPLDAQAAAKAVQAGEVTVTPRAATARWRGSAGCGSPAPRRCAMRTQASNARNALLAERPRRAPRAAPRPVSDPAGTRRGQPSAGPDHQPLAAAMLALRTLARRHQALSGEITALTTELDRLTSKAAPQLVALFGVGSDSAGALLVAGDNPGRLRSDACFSMLCGASPIEASSGKTTRHRRNRGGDRQANAALYRIVLVRLCYDQQTKAYMARRRKEGKSKKEIIRCLKRYVAREVFAVLQQMRATDSTNAA